MNPPTINDVRIRKYTPLITPRELKQALPLTAAAEQTVIAGRETIQRILCRQDSRLLVISGPCSIHDEKAALEYAARLADLRSQVSLSLFVVMRVYFEKPRTSVGWKGLINDPHLDGSCDMHTGLRKARRILLAINAMGVPVATEMLDPITPQYIAELVSWSAVGARTTESQTHREMASGLSMPIGFKNGTDGNLNSAVNALVATRTPQSFLGIDQDGQTCIVETGGNPWGSIVLRGGQRPNYDPISIEEARLMLLEQGLNQAVMVDCSHANSFKKHQGQPTVWRQVIDQCIGGNQALIGLMLESNLMEGNQKITTDPSKLAYGVSITDACISWEITETLLKNTHEKIQAARSGSACRCG